jgi:hypothetical protein
MRAASKIKTRLGASSDPQTPACAAASAGNLDIATAGTGLSPDQRCEAASISPGVLAPRSSKVQAEHTGRSLQFAGLSRGRGGVGWIDEKSDRLGRGHQLVQQLEPLCDYLDIAHGHTGEIDACELHHLGPLLPFPAATRWCLYRRGFMTSDVTAR